MATKHRRSGHLFKRGKTFYVRWSLEGKIYQQALYTADGKPITTRRDAEEARAKVMAPFTAGDEAAVLESITAKLDGRRAELARLKDELNPPLPIAKAWIEFAKAPNRPDSGEATMRQYGCQWNQFAAWIAEKHAAVAAMRDVTKELAGAYAEHLIASKLSPNTYNKHLNLLSLVWRVLVDKARTNGHGNPWADIQRKRLATQSRRELTVEELRNICQAAEGEMKTLLAVGVYTGLRLGDAATLRWGEVDMARGIIRRIPGKTSRRNPKPVLIPIHPTLRAILAETPDAKRKDDVLPETAALYRRRIDGVTDLVQAHFKACGIAVHKAGTGQNGKRAVVEVGFHALRHTFVSLCRESNAPLAVVESIVGHSNPAMTRFYTHTGEVAAGAAIALLPCVTGAEQPVPAKPSAEAVLREARALVESMTAETWCANRDALLALLPKEAGSANIEGRGAACPD